jgi:predicted PurR-regulated permease PerM
MDIPPIPPINELSALITILLIAIFTIVKGIPALIAYMKEKDAIHREDMINIIESARKERELFYEKHNEALGKIHGRLDKIESSINNTTSAITQLSSSSNRKQ